MRNVVMRYQDPLELIWVRTASLLGMTIERDSNVFAAWDGEGTLRIGTPETLDADDSLAQMVFHEMCHAMIEGPAAMRLADWGLDITNPRERVREHACLRLQAALADRHGLRDFLAATTDFREYYDRLPAKPLAPGSDPAIEIASVGWQRANQPPWSDPLNRALSMTATLAEVIRDTAAPIALGVGFPQTLASREAAAALSCGR